MAPALFLMGIGPIARWRKAELPAIAHRLKWAFAVTIVAALLLPLTAGELRPLTSVGLAFGIWILAAAVVILADSLRGADGRIAPRRARLLPASVWGMHVAHIGIAVFVLGVTAVKSYEVDYDGRMEVGQTIDVAGYQIRFDGLGEYKGPNYDAVRGRFTVTRNGSPVTTLRPEKRVYRSTGQPMTEAAIDRSLLRDVYVSMGEPLGGNAWAMRAHVKPLVNWIWLGCVLMAIGGFLAAGDRRYRRSAREAQARASASAASIA